MKFKHIILMSGLTVCTAYTMENEPEPIPQSKLIRITSLKTIIPYTIIPHENGRMSLERLLYSKEPKTEEMKEKGIKRRYIKMPIYIETHPHSIDSPLMDYSSRTIPAAILLPAIQNKQCYYEDADNSKLWRNMRTERWYVPCIVITDNPNASPGDKVDEKKSMSSVD